MKAIILAGGLGTRLGEETNIKPKPMVEIGGRPILWHIMKHYAAYNVTEFIVCCGYKGYVIKEYFANYFLHLSDITFYTAENRMEVHNRRSEDWKVTLVDTGEESMTGGRLKCVRDYVKGDDAFCFTYGDGLGDIDIGALVSFHREKGKLATVTAVFAPGRFGALTIETGSVRGFAEKPRGDGARINGGFFVLSPGVFDYVEGDLTTWEREPMEALAKQGQLAAFEHNGFWQPMDTMRDKLHLERLWQSGHAPWKIWA